MRFEAPAREKIGSEASYELAIEAKLRELLVALTAVVGDLLCEASCFECNRMSAVFQGAFAVYQVRKHLEQSRAAEKYRTVEEEEEDRDGKNSAFGAKVLQEGREPTPLKYNSKLMNSIWGLYNRYSVHNFKKIDANEASLLAEAWGKLRPEAAASEGPRIIGAGH